MAMGEKFFVQLREALLLHPEVLESVSVSKMVQSNYTVLVILLHFL